MDTGARRTFALASQPWSHEHERARFARSVDLSRRADRCSHDAQAADSGETSPPDPATAAATDRPKPQDAFRAPGKPRESSERAEGRAQNDDGDQGNYATDDD